MKLKMDVKSVLQEKLRIITQSCTAKFANLVSMRGALEMTSSTKSIKHGAVIGAERPNFTTKRPKWFRTWKNKKVKARKEREAYWYGD